jgi:hypothetical protein
MYIGNFTSIHKEESIITLHISAGIIINEILTREKPYANKQLSPEFIFQQVCTIDLRPRMQPPGKDDFTQGMNSIVSDCLQRSSYARPSFKKIGVYK